MDAKGKLHAQLGLVYTSLQMFDEAIRSFEQALPLIRTGNSPTAAQAEASILQNIGAVYNEKGLYAEAVIYHREAAALHGKSKSSIYRYHIILPPTQLGVWNLVKGK